VRESVLRTQSPCSQSGEWVFEVRVLIVVLSDLGFATGSQAEIADGGEDFEENGRHFRALDLFPLVAEQLGLL
jgi:hypothetical protein